MIKYKGHFITSTQDVGENEGGLFCQVYTDENFENEVDYFVIDKKYVKHNDDDKTILEFLNRLEC